jgi:hypothetical protein
MDPQTPSDERQRLLMDLALARRLHDAAPIGSVTQLDLAEWIETLEKGLRALDEEG